ncbi:MAG: hypothetical protein IIA23_06915 [Chloroflexi bacterium]|nr:hypothetical protein [Chloroflexota bacterium]
MFTQAWLGPVLALTLAIGIGLLIAELLMTPPAGELGELGAYLALSGAATLGGGWLALRFADRALGLSIQAKAFLGAAIGSGVGRGTGATGALGAVFVHPCGRLSRECHR